MKRKFQLKTWGFVRIFLPDFELHFSKNLNLFHFSWHIIWLACRMVTIFLLTQESRLSGPFRYLKHVRTIRRKFSRNLWKKVSAQKIMFCQNIPTWFLASCFQNLYFFHFFWHIIWWVCRAVASFLLTQGSRLSGPFRYLEHVRKIRRKFSRSLRKHFQPKTFFENKAQNHVGIF